MKKSLWVFVVLNLCVLDVNAYLYVKKQRRPAPVPQKKIVEPKAPTPEKHEPELVLPQIKTQIPGYQNYAEIVEQLKTWDQQAADFTEVGIYGQTAQHQDLYYLRLTNEKQTGDKQRVLLTACIHGNEPWCTAVLMATLGTMLGTYGEDAGVTELVDGREIYFIPVVSPDSYPRSRHVDGVDPNRDFEDQRSETVRALQKFFLEIKPQAALSAHTYGRVFLKPWGNRLQPCPDNADYDRILGKVADLCDYRLIQACEMYHRPIYGTEVDWYYARGSFATVMEMGDHQDLPSMRETTMEFNRTYRGILYFIQEAPLTEMQPGRYRLVDAYSGPQVDLQDE